MLYTTTVRPLPSKADAECNSCECIAQCTVHCDIDMSVHWLVQISFMNRDHSENFERAMYICICI